MCCYGGDCVGFMLLYSMGKIIRNFARCRMDGARYCKELARLRMGRARLCKDAACRCMSRARLRKDVACRCMGHARLCKDAARYCMGVAHCCLTRAWLCSGSARSGIGLWRHGAALVRCAFVKEPVLLIRIGQAALSAELERPDRLNSLSLYTHVSFFHYQSGAVCAGFLGFLCSFYEGHE